MNTEFIRQVETTKSIEELSIELGMVVAYGKVIDVLLAEQSNASKEEAYDFSVISKTLSAVRQQVLELSRKVGE